MTAPILNMAGRPGDARPAIRAGLVAQEACRSKPLTAAPVTIDNSAGAGQGFTVTLPLPPSANNLFVTRGNRRPRSPEYDAWIEAARWALHCEKLQPVTGPYAFLLALPYLMRGDCSNRLKAPEDLLVKVGLTPDDRHADLVMAHRSNAVSGVACIVTVVPIQHVSAALASVGGGPRPLPALLPQEGAEAA
jgi:hypothetical protein